MRHLGATLSDRRLLSPSVVSAHLSLFAKEPSLLEMRLSLLRSIHVLFAPSNQRTPWPRGTAEPTPTVAPPTFLRRIFGLASLPPTLLIPLG